MERRFIPLAAPVLIGNEKAYVMDCLESTWISSKGKYIQQFESAFAKYCGVKHALSCCNGSAALHLALNALGVGPGDEVIVPTLTFVAPANAVSYCGARPIFVDSCPETWTMDPSLIEAQITPHTRGIIVVHLYGYPVDMDPVLSIASRHGLFVLEDSAQALGAEYKGRRVGSIGDVATFSFHGSKVITTGEGGMVTTNDAGLASKVRQLKERGMDPDVHYWFPVVGYNYGLTNISAAIGLAQMEKAAWHLQRRLEVVSWYQEQFRGDLGVIWQSRKAWAKSGHWMFTIILDDRIPSSRDAVRIQLRDRGIETRPVFYPMHILPPYWDSSHYDRFPVAERTASRGISLPTWAGMTRDDVCYVCEILLESLNSESACNNNTIT